MSDSRRRSPEPSGRHAGILVEACVTSVQEGVMAVEAGAHRLELCARLDVGGLTPDPLITAELAATVAVPVMVMIRQRAGPFVTDAADLEAMETHAEEALRAGAAGLVFGFATEEGRIDVDACQRLLRVAAGVPVTFHRAFDALEWCRGREPEARAAAAIATLGELAELGVQRVLTGGGPGDAFQQRYMVAHLVAHSAPGPTVLVAGGVRADHVGRLLEETGAREVHARASAIPALVAVVR